MIRDIQVENTRQATNEGIETGTPKVESVAKTTSDYGTRLMEATTTDISKNKPSEQPEAAKDKKTDTILVGGDKIGNAIDAATDTIYVGGEKIGKAIESATDAVLVGGEKIGEAIETAKEKSKEKSEEEPNITAGAI